MYFLLIALFIICICIILFFFKQGKSELENNEIENDAIENNKIEKNNIEDSSGIEVTEEKIPVYKNLCNKWDKCLASPGNNNSNGTGLIQWDKTNEEGQRWSFV